MLDHQSLNYHLTLPPSGLHLICRLGPASPTDPLCQRTNGKATSHKLLAASRKPPQQLNPSTSQQSSAIYILLVPFVNPRFHPFRFFPIFSSFFPLPPVAAASSPPLFHPFYRAGHTWDIRGTKAGYIPLPVKDQGLGPCWYPGAQALNLSRVKVRNRMVVKNYPWPKWVFVAGFDRFWYYEEKEEKEEIRGR